MVGRLATESRDMVILGDPARGSLQIGDSVTMAGTIYWEDSACYLHGLWHGEVYRVTSTGLFSGVWTLYDFRFDGTCSGIPVLVWQRDSLQLPCKQASPASFRSMIEVCCGLGGISLRAARVVVSTCLHVDRSSLACETIRANNGVVIHGDIQDPAIQQAIHSATFEAARILGAGFPCQHYSLQGQQKGLQDPRGWVLHAVLQIAWRTQSCAVVLECVSQVQHHSDVMCLLNDFAARRGFRFHQVCLELADQWCSRRHRWWELLLPHTEVTGSLLPWPKNPVQLTVGEVLPELPQWDLPEEQELKWTDLEQERFNDPLYGTDARVLDLALVAPTALHSWGNPLSRCPCGCRQAGFTLERLQSGGLRGIGVYSNQLQSMRHLHPKEAALLNTLSPELQFVQGPRAGLCLVGQLSAPLQAALVVGHLVRWTPFDPCDTPPLDLGEILADYKQLLLQQRDDTFPLPSMALPGHVCLRQDGQHMQIKVLGPTKVAQLLQAEKQMAEPGLTFALFCAGRRLDPSACLHQGEQWVYDLQVQRTRQTKPRPLQPFSVAMLTAHGLRFCCLQSSVSIETLLDRERLPVGQAVCLVTGKLLAPFTMLAQDAVLELRTPSGLVRLPPWCMEATLWNALCNMLSQNSLSHVHALHPAVVSFLSHCDCDAGQPSVPGYQLPPGTTQCLLLLHHEVHWACVSAQLLPSGVAVTYFDGFGTQSCMVPWQLALGMWKQRFSSSRTHNTVDCLPYCMLHVPLPASRALRFPWSRRL